MDCGDDTETEIDEAITPDNSFEAITRVMTPTKPSKKKIIKENGTPSKPEDVAAAITLLGFKVRN